MSSAVFSMPYAGYQDHSKPYFQAHHFAWYVFSRGPKGKAENCKPQIDVELNLLSFLDPRLSLDEAHLGKSY